MKKISQEELKKILNNHKLWLDGDNNEGEKSGFISCRFN